MGTADFSSIPAVARRLQGQELGRRITSLETELKRLREEQAERESELEQLREARADYSAELEALRSALGRMSSEAEELNATLQELVTENECLRSSIAIRDSDLVNEEIVTCRSIADKCLFVIGFGRSNTTLTLELLNCANNALLLGEANFFLAEHSERFSHWYNNQHREFGNQITKSSYAPDFLPAGPHTWWQWLRAAAQFYDCIGEKIAFSDYHLGVAPPEKIRAFHEARFLTSRYIFTLRDPTTLLLSAAKHTSVTDDAGMTRLCAAWLDFMQLWADFIRVFPRTLTILSERYGEATVNDLEAFTGLKLGDASLLIDPALRRTHKLTGRFPTLVRLQPELEEIYASAVAATDESHAFWQAEQKRSPSANDSRGKSLGSIAMKPRPLGQVWIRARELRNSLTPVLEETGQ
jgi:hypothetical protein